jgi:D-alanine-D-alanine ligase
MNIAENIIKLKPLKICILNSDYSKSTSPLKKIYEKFPLDPRVHLKKYDTIEWDSVLIDKANIYSQINKLRQKRYDLYFNLCSGVLDDDIAGFEVIRALEYYNLAYTGPNEKFCLLKKSAMKSLALSSGINTPKFYFAYDDKDIELTDKHIATYPMFVKHFNGNDSIGLTSQSKVNNFEEMKLMASKFIFDYGGALIEEFIDGREYTVLVIENEKDKYNPFVLDPIECEFHNGETFKHFYVKNRDVNGSVRKVKVDNVQMKRKLEEMAQKAFIYMYGKSYARVDIRADKNGKLYFLEINAPPTTFWHSPNENNSDFIIKNNSLLKPEEVVLQIIHSGLVGYKKRQLPYYVSFTNEIYNGLGLSRICLKNINREAI